MLHEQAFRAMDENDSGRVGLEDMIKFTHEFGIKFELVGHAAV